MLSNIGGPTLIVILFIVLLLFGAPKLPALARSLGQSMKILKKEVSTEDQAKAQDEQSKSEAGESANAESVANTPESAKSEAAPRETSKDEAK